MIIITTFKHTNFSKACVCFDESLEITYLILMEKFASTLPFSCEPRTLCYIQSHYRRYSQN